jgi:hypothetical protein
MDVHQATICVAVMDCRGKLIMECILETKAATIQARSGTTGGLRKGYRKTKVELHQGGDPQGESYRRPPHE